MVLIFASDFNNMQIVVDFLAQWILAAMTSGSRISNAPTIYLVLDTTESLSKQELWQLISKRLLDQLDTLDPIKRRSFTEAHVT